MKYFKKLSINLPHTICLHRLHDDLPISSAHSFQKMIGMSISIEKLECLLQNEKEKSAHGDLSNVLITIDDGHRDILKLIPIIQKYKLQPILFLTGDQLRGNNKTLPLTALYSWCTMTGRDPDLLKEELGFNRISLKHMRQSEQERLLKAAGIPLDPAEERMLSVSEIGSLITEGCLIGYHGPEHCDLRIIPEKELSMLFDHDKELLERNGYIKVIAWPEGWWNTNIASIAFTAGFTSQFGLSHEYYYGDNLLIAKREIWK